MKKKVLSVLLATALFAGSAVSASALTWGDWDSSSKSGTDEDITALSFDKTSYDVENGGDINLSEKLTAYAGTKAIVQEPTLDWTISDNDLTFGLEVEDNVAKVFAYENKGTATVTVTANDGKVKATCKVVATPMTKSTGYKFKESSYTLPVGDGQGVYVVDKSVKLVPTPNDAKFSERQYNQLGAGVEVALVATKQIKDINGNEIYAADTVIAVASQDGDKNKDGVEFKFDASDLANVSDRVTSARLIVVKAGTATINQELPDNAEKFAFNAYDSDKEPKTISRDVKASTKLAKSAERAGRTGSITIEVGQTADLGDYVKYGPSDANVCTDDNLSKWSIDYYNEAATDDDFAVLNADGDKVLGVAVGKVKAVATFDPEDSSKDDIVVEIPINVVAKGSVVKSEMELSATSATLEVGGTTWVEVKNAASDTENIEWTVEDNGVATIVPTTGAGIKVFAKKAGTAKVTASYNGEEIGTMTVTVNAAGTVAPVVPTPDNEVPNPGTGDSLFANLF